MSDTLENLGGTGPTGPGTPGPGRQGASSLGRLGSVSLTDAGITQAAARRAWASPERYWPLLTAATADLSAPVAALDLGALRANADDLRARAGGVPIRIASKSIRVRGVIDALLELGGFAGVLGYTLAEALWLAADGPDRTGIPDVVVGYPTADRAALAALAADETLASRVTIMIDDVAQLDLVDAVVAPSKRAPIRVAIELDASWDAPLLGHIGVYRSPLHTPEAVRALAEHIVARDGFRLVGMMAYEAQIAGVGNAPIGHPLDGRVKRWMQSRSVPELAERRRAAVAAVRELVDLEFVNGGGTGSLEATAREDAVTDIAAGSGFFGPHLFDNYAHFSPAPAAAWALDVVRRPTPEIATLLGGGWIASGPAASDRLPQLVWPEGLEYLPREAAGEVQSPVTGPAAADLRVGDRVWLRHTKAGELSEHVDALQLVLDGERVGEVPTYRGEGKVFL